MRDFRVVNIVIRVQTLGAIDVASIVPRLGFGVYNPLVYAPATLKFVNPKLTVNIFSTGVVMIMGSRSVFGAYYVLNYLKNIFGWKIGTIRIANMMIIYDMGHTVDVPLFKETYRANCVYDPSLFPSCIYKRHHDRQTASVFSTGRLNIYGCRTIEEIEDTLEDVIKKIEEISSGLPSLCSALAD